MTKRVLFVHYTPPGVIGGVEHVMLEHKRLLESRGYRVTIAAGREGSGDVPVTVIPELNVATAENMRLEEELEKGRVPPEFAAKCARIADALGPLVAEVDTVIVHNAFTLHFCLPLTVVLRDFARDLPDKKMVAWCHDLSWINPLYVHGMHPGEPWSILQTPQKGVTYVAISQERRAQLWRVWGERGPDIEVVPNGIDPDAFLGLSPKTKEIVRRYCLFDRDVVLLVPVRITRRKNLELGIRTVGALRDQGKDACFLISGPEASHHPGKSGRYLKELKTLRAELGLTDHVVFLADELGDNLDYREVSELFAVADALLFTSEQEGFGLPLLETGLRRLPAVLSDLSIFREIGGEDVSRFALDDSALDISKEVLNAIDNGPSRLYRRVLRDYRWDVIADKMLVPLLSRLMRSSAPAPGGT